MEKLSWEYRTLKLVNPGLFSVKIDSTKFDEALNELGGVGWELVSVLDTTHMGQTRDVVAIFKRPCHG